MDLTIPRLREADYFDEQVEMHYAFFQSAERIGPQPHCHEFFEIFLVIDGAIRHFVNGEQAGLTAGALVFIRPDDVHYYRPVPHKQCHLVNLAISRQVIQALFAYLGAGFHSERILQLPLPPMVSLTPGITHLMHQKMGQLHQIPIDSSAEKRTALRMLLFELVTQYFPRPAPIEQSSLPNWLQAACLGMQQPENFRHGIPRMLQLAAVTPEHLARSMQRYLEVTPTNFINQLRMTFAANLLQYSDQSIADIADETGIESLSYFYLLFKRHFGQTPRQFRRDNQRQPIVPER